MNSNISSKFAKGQHMSSDNIEIFYYRDLASEAIPSHSHDFYELYFFLEGNIDYMINNTIYALNPRDILLIPPNSVHKPIIKDNNTSTYCRFVLWINSDFYDSLVTIDPDIIYLTHLIGERKSHKINIPENLFQGIESQFISLLEESINPKFCHTLNSRILAASILVKVNRVIYEMNTSQVVDTRQELYINICNYIGANLVSDLSLNTLANKFFVSKYYICHVFKEHLGISVHQYIIRKRLADAKAKILAGVPISNIHIQCGFNDYTSFYRSFKKEFGVSPKEFKSKHRVQKLK